MKAYTLDGVVTPRPPRPPRPWRRMAAPDRKAYRDQLESFWSTAPCLLRPEDPSFHLLTTRRQSAATDAWVKANMPDGRFSLHYLPPGVPKTDNAVATWKAEVIKGHGITELFEPNPAVWRLLSAAVGDRCTITLAGPGGGAPPRRVRRSGRLDGGGAGAAQGPNAGA